MWGSQAGANIANSWTISELLIAIVISLTILMCLTLFFWLEKKAKSTKIGLDDLTSTSQKNTQSNTSEPIKQNDEEQKPNTSDKNDNEINQGYEWEKSIYLEKNEKIITFWTGNRETISQRMYFNQYGGGSYDGRNWKNGILALTNQRLMFLEERGFFEKSHHQTLTIPLNEISGISVGGSMIPFVSIADRSQSYTFHLNGIAQRRIS